MPKLIKLYICFIIIILLFLKYGVLHKFVSCLHRLMLILSVLFQF